MRAGLLLVLAVLLVAGCERPSASPAGDPTSPTPRDDAIAVPTVPSPASATSPAAPNAGCEPTAHDPTGSIEDIQLDVEPVVDGLTHPSGIFAAANDPRLFVLELDGRIRVVQDGTLRDEPFLDITDRVEAVGDGGLIGLAFHPAFADNGRLYVHYDDANADTVIAEFRVSGDAAVVDPSSERVLLTVDQPHRTQQGGTIAFGPDGYLYIGLGDGGGDGAERNGQDTSTLLGSILRIDVDGRDAGREYAIPPDNPFAKGQGGAPEVWAYGLRNPWRFTFDIPSCQMVIADVGSKAVEEVSAIPIGSHGANLGWAIREGDRCYEAETCRDEGLVAPVLTYPHRPDACAIVGGHVYRGGAIPELQGHYFYSDYCGGFLRSFRLERGGTTDEVDWTDQVGKLGFPLSFGVGPDDELYIAEAGGTVSRIVSVGD